MTSDLREPFRARLSVALRARDRTAVAAIRTVLAALDNAEAVPAPAKQPASGATSLHVAGGVAGLGAAEAQRCELTQAEQQALVGREIDDRLAAADGYESREQHERATRLRLEAEILRSVLQES